MTRTLSASIFFLTILLVGACTVGKNYQQPELQLPTQYRFVTTADSSSIADVNYNSFFNDTSLLRLIDQGVRYNYDLQLAIRRLDEGRQRLKQAKLLQLPELSLQVTAQSSNPSNNSLNGISLKSFLGTSHLEDYSAAAVLSWEADIWGKLRRQKEAATAEYLATYEGVKAVQTQLVADIAQGYYNLLMLDAQLEVARKNLVFSDSTLLFTRLQRTAGDVTTLAVQQAEVQQQSTALIIPQLEEEIAVQENALSVILGINPDSVYRVNKLTDYQLSSQLPVGLPAAIVSRRPDVRARELALMAANAQVGVAQSYLYPSLMISASGGLNSFKASNWLNVPASLFGLVAGSIAQPIFQRGQIKTNIEIANIRREEAVIEFRRTVTNSLAEVSNALVRQQKLEVQYAIANKQVDTLQSAIKNARLLFKSGMANYLEVISAQENLLQAELNLASIKRQQVSAVIELYRAVGGGWK